MPSFFQKLACCTAIFAVKSRFQQWRKLKLSSLLKNKELFAVRYRYAEHRRTLRQAVLQDFPRHSRKHWCSRNGKTEIMGCATGSSTTLSEQAKMEWGNHSDHAKGIWFLCGQHRPRAHSLSKRLGRTHQKYLKKLAKIRKNRPFSCKIPQKNAKPCVNYSRQENSKVL